MKTPVHRLLLLLAIAFTMMLASCSLATLAYNNAYTVLSYSLDDYFDLSDEQREWLKPRVEQFLAWHRSTELPVYQRLLADTRVRAQQPIAAADIANLYDEGKVLLERVTVRALPEMSAFVMQLEPAQLAFLEKKFAKDNVKMRRELDAPLSKRQRKRAERYVERLSDWMGSLNAAQEAQIAAALARLAPLDELRLADRIARQEAFLQLARAKPDEATMSRELRMLLLEPERLRDPAYHTEWARQQKDIFALIASVLSSATPAQKAHMDKRFAGYAKDITSLMRGG